MIQATNQFVDLLEHILAAGAFTAFGIYIGVSRRMAIKVTFKEQRSNVTHHVTETDDE